MRPLSAPCKKLHPSTVKVLAPHGTTAMSSTAHCITLSGYLVKNKHRNEKNKKTPPDLMAKVLYIVSPKQK